MRTFVRFVVLSLVVVLVSVPVPAPAAAFRAHVRDADKLDASAELQVDGDAEAEADTWATARATAIASQMNDEMLHDLLTAGGSEDGQVGIECELQNAPRVVVAALYPLSKSEKDPTKQGYFKAKAAIEPEIAKIQNSADRPELLETLVVPQIYGQCWLESTNGAWKICQDNEQGWGSSSAKVNGKGRFQPHPRLIKWWTSNNRIPAVYLPPNNLFSGLSSAMELVTVPLNTDLTPLKEKPGTGATLTYTAQAMRIWIQTLKKFMLLKAEGGLANDYLLSDLTRDEQRVFQFAFANSKFEKQEYALKVVVPLTVVRNQFKADLQGYDGVWSNKLSEQYHLSEYTELHGFFGDAPYVHFDMDRYVCFPLLSSLVNTKAIRKAFKFANQLNFGFPVANFASRSGSLELVKGDQKYIDKPPQRNWRRFTAKIWPHLQSLSSSLLGSIAIKCDEAFVDPKIEHCRLSAAAKMEVHGFFTLLSWYYFLTGYLDLQGKFSHQVAIKSPVNDVLRNLSPLARRVISNWLQVIAAGQPDPAIAIQTHVVKLLEALSKTVWYAANLKPDGFPASKPLSDRSRDPRSIIVNILEPVETDEKARWLCETSLDKLGRIGKFNPDNTNYPPNRDAETPVNKPVNPFKIGGKPAVLLEHRGGSNFADKWVSVWKSPKETPKAMEVELSGAELGGEMKRLQTPNEQVPALIETLRTRTRSRGLSARGRGVDPPKKGKLLDPAQFKVAVVKRKGPVVFADPVDISDESDDQLDDEPEHTQSTTTNIAPAKPSKQDLDQVQTLVAQASKPDVIAKHKKALEIQCKATGHHAMLEEDKIAWGCPR